MLRFRTDDVVEVLEVLSGDCFGLVDDLHLVITSTLEDEILGPIEEMEPSITILRNFNIDTDIGRQLCGCVFARLSGLSVSETGVGKGISCVGLSILEVETCTAQLRIDI